MSNTSKLSRGRRQTPCRPETRFLIDHFAQVTQRGLSAVTHMAILSLYREQGMKLPEPEKTSRRKSAAA